MCRLPSGRPQIFRNAGPQNFRNHRWTKSDPLQRDNRRLRPGISTCCARSSTSYGGRIGSLVRGIEPVEQADRFSCSGERCCSSANTFPISGEHDPAVQGKRCGSTAKSIPSGYWFEVHGRGIGIPSRSGPDLVGDGKRVARQGERCAWATGADRTCEGIDPDGPLVRGGRARGGDSLAKRAIRPVQWFDDHRPQKGIGRARAAIRTVHWFDRPDLRSGSAGEGGGPVLVPCHCCVTHDEAQLAAMQPINALPSWLEVMSMPG